MATENLQRWTVYFCGALALIILVAAILFAIAGCVVSADRFQVLKEIFQEAIQNVLLSMFTTVVTAALIYIFGKELVSALAFRIRSIRSTPSA